MTGSETPLRVLPLMFARHPAYRAQLDSLRSIDGITMLSTLPADSHEHERWQRTGQLRKMIEDGLLPRLSYDIYRKPEDRVIVFGRLPRWVLKSAYRTRIHVDADDPLSVLPGGTRERVLTGRNAEVAVAIAQAAMNGALTISFWTRIQLLHFLAYLPFDISSMLLESGRLARIPPGISGAEEPLPIGSAPELRCLVLPGGKFWPKGIGEAIAAVHQAVSDGHRITLTVLGAGVPDDWRDFLGRQPYAKLIDWAPRSEVDQAFASTDLLLFPSHHDTYGWVILEAKRLGIPTLATNFYSRPEIIESGVDGMLLDDPFSSPFLATDIVPFAQAHMSIRNGRIEILDTLRSFIDAMAGAIGALAQDRSRLRSLGKSAWRRTRPHGEFDAHMRARRLAELISA